MTKQLTPTRTETHAESSGGAPGRTLAGLAASAATRHSGAALRHKTEGRWEDISYGQLGKIAAEIAKGLIAIGIERGDRVSILSNTRPEWTFVDLGSLAAGATLAPIYQTNSPGECAYVLNHSQARLVFCENEEQLAKIAEVRGECPALEHVVALEGSIEGSISLTALRELGSPVDRHAPGAASPPSRRRTSRRSSTRPAPPAHRRAACSATATSSRRWRCTCDGSGLTTPTRCSCSCRSRTSLHA